MSDSGEITRLLDELGSGNKDAEARLIEAVYPQLRRIAGRCLRGERPGHILQATALVNEAYPELIAQNGKSWKNRGHFYGVAAHIMRRILVNYARERNAQKRGGDRPQAELTDVLAISDDGLDQIVQVHEALERLAVLDPRQAKVVELRFFGGLTEEETAEILTVAPRTVKRDWRAAKAWLHGELNGRSQVD